jgi:hypothetical protein
VSSGILFNKIVVKPTISCKIAPNVAETIVKHMISCKIDFLFINLDDLEY